MEINAEHTFAFSGLFASFDAVAFSAMSRYQFLCNQPTRRWSKRSNRDQITCRNGLPKTASKDLPTSHWELIRSRMPRFCSAQARAIHWHHSDSMSQDANQI